MRDAFSIVVCALAIGLAIAFVAKNELNATRAPAWRALVVVVTAVAAAATGWVTYSVINPPKPYAEAELTVGGPALSADIPDARTELIVHGGLGPDGHSLGQGTYTVTVSGDGPMPLHLAGTLRRQVQTRKYMRRGRTTISTERLEGRHVLPAQWRAKRVTVVVKEETGDLMGPMHVSLVPASPPEVPLLVGALLLCILGSLADATMRTSKTFVGMTVAVLGAFALLLLEAPHPLELSHLLRTVPVALILGALVGSVVRWIAARVARPVPASH